MTACEQTSMPEEYPDFLSSRKKQIQEHLCIDATTKTQKALLREKFANEYSQLIEIISTLRHLPQLRRTRSLTFVEQFWKIPRRADSPKSTTDRISEAERANKCLMALCLDYKPKSQPRTAKVCSDDSQQQVNIHEILENNLLHSDLAKLLSRYFLEKRLPDPQISDTLSDKTKPELVVA